MTGPVLVADCANCGTPKLARCSCPFCGHSENKPGSRRQLRGTAAKP